ncbi:YaeQ family protein [Limnobacter sp.]|uniref:YaeQ family protein n=1 Tax=Limnobacter sp. TaxID=2003368 RepID=UPI0035133651
MALGATIYKAQLDISDLDRHYFASHALTLALHPSETEERLMVRLLAFVMNADQDLQFGKGISSEGEAAVWNIDPTGRIRLWVEVGQPDETRVRKACGRADAVVVYCYSRAAEVWWKQNQEWLNKLDKVTVVQLAVEDTQTLASLAQRNMVLACTVQEGLVYINEASVQPVVLKAVG